MLNHALLPGILSYRKKVTGFIKIFAWLVPFKNGVSMHADPDVFKYLFNNKVDSCIPLQFIGFFKILVKEKLQCNRNERLIFIWDN